MLDFEFYARTTSSRGLLRTPRALLFCAAIASVTASCQSSSGSASDVSSSDIVAVGDTGSWWTGEINTPEADASTCYSRPNDQCDLVTQNCASGAKCVYSVASSSAVCESFDSGAGVAQSACKSDGDCGAGLLCVNAICSAPCCTGDDQSCGFGGHCDIQVLSGSQPVFYACNYPATCTPFANNCATANTVCVGEGASFLCVPTANVATAPGGTCQSSLDCGESQTCVSGICRLLCLLAVDADATADAHDDTDSRTTPDAASPGDVTPATDASSTVDAAITLETNDADIAQNGSDPDAEAIASWDAATDLEATTSIAVNRFPANGECKVAGTYYGDCVAIVSDSETGLSSVGICLP